MTITPIPNFMAQGTPFVHFLFKLASDDKMISALTHLASLAAWGDLTGWDERESLLSQAACICICEHVPCNARCSDTIELGRKYIEFFLRRKPEWLTGPHPIVWLKIQNRANLLLHAVSQYCFATGADL